MSQKSISFSLNLPEEIVLSDLLCEAAKVQGRAVLVAELDSLLSRLSKYPKYALHPMILYQDGSGRLVSFRCGKVEKEIAVWDSLQEGIFVIQRLLRIEECKLASKRNKTC